MKTQDIDAALLGMCEQTVSFSSIQVKGLSIESKDMVTIHVYCSARRNGPHIEACVFSTAPRPNDGRIERFVLQALLYSIWPRECCGLFGEKPKCPKENQDDAWSTKSAHLKWCYLNNKEWSYRSSVRMSKAMDRIFKDSPPKYHSAVDELAQNVRQAVSELATPVDLYMKDLMGPLRSALAKGASRDDLIRLVDEAVAESVMKS